MPDSYCAYGCTNRREENGDRALIEIPTWKERRATRTSKKVGSRM